MSWFNVVMLVMCIMLCAVFFMAGYALGSKEAVSELRQLINESALVMHAKPYIMRDRRKEQHHES